jgi:hypothetical protein
MDESVLGLSVCRGNNVKNARIFCILTPSPPPPPRHPYYGTTSLCGMDVGTKDPCIHVVGVGAVHARCTSPSIMSADLDN